MKKGEKAAKIHTVSLTALIILCTGASIFFCLLSLARERTGVFLDFLELWCGDIALTKHMIQKWGELSHLASLEPVWFLKRKKSRKFRVSAIMCCLKFHFFEKLPAYDPLPRFGVSHSAVSYIASLLHIWVSSGKSHDFKRNLVYIAPDCNRPNYCNHTSSAPFLIWTFSSTA